MANNNKVVLDRQILEEWGEYIQDETDLDNEKFYRELVKRTKKALIILHSLAVFFVTVNFSLWFFFNKVSWSTIGLGAPVIATTIGAVFWLQRGQKKKLNDFQTKIVMRS